jgi:hypothetical protein
MEYTQVHSSSITQYGSLQQAALSPMEYTQVHSSSITPDGSLQQATLSPLEYTRAHSSSFTQDLWNGRQQTAGWLLDNHQDPQQLILLILNQYHSSDQMEVWTSYCHVHMLCSNYITKINSICQAYVQQCDICECVVKHRIFKGRLSDEQSLTLPLLLSPLTIQSCLMKPLKPTQRSSPPL